MVMTQLRQLNLGVWGYRVTNWVMKLGLSHLLMHGQLYWTFIYPTVVEILLRQWKIRYLSSKQDILDGQTNEWIILTIHCLSLLINIKSVWHGLHDCNTHGRPPFVLVLIWNFLNITNDRRKVNQIILMLYTMMMIAHSIYMIYELIHLG